MYLKTWDDYILQDIADFFNTFRYNLKQKQEYLNVNIYESNDGLLLESEVPGVEPDKINVEIKDNVLTFSVERSNPLNGDYKIIKNEIEYGKFIRNIQLPFKVKYSDIKAEYKSGILKVFLPKADEERPKKIEIQSNS